MLAGSAKLNTNQIFLRSIKEEKFCLLVVDMMPSIYLFKNAVT